MVYIITMDENSTYIVNHSVPINTDEISVGLQMTRFVADRILVPIIVSLGILGNTCNICVLSRPKMRTSTNVYLTNLAIFDMLYLAFMLTLSMMHCRDTDLNESDYYYIPYGRVLADLFGNCSVWVTVCFTLERYIGVCHPMRGKAWCTVQKAKLLTFVVFVFCFLNTLPGAFENEVIIESKDVYLKTDQPKQASNGSFNYTKNISLYLDVDGNQSYTRKYYSCKTSELAESVSFQFGYYWWYITIFTFIPVLLLSIFNIFLIKSVWKANRMRKLLSQSHVLGEHYNQSVEQQNVTTMLISVVIIFLICQFPWAILLLYKVYISALINIPHRTNDHILIAGNVCNLLGQLNASINFILYSYFSSRFRRTFNKLFCRWHKRRKPANIFSTEFTCTTRKADYSRDNVTTSFMSYKYNRRSVIGEVTPIWKAPHSMLPDGLCFSRR